MASQGISYFASVVSNISNLAALHLISTPNHAVVLSTLRDNCSYEFSLAGYVTQENKNRTKGENTEVRYRFTDWMSIDA